MDSDKVTYRNDDDLSWVDCYVITNGSGQIFWWSNAVADVQITPGQVLWVDKGVTAAKRDTAVFCGRSFTTNDVATFNFKTNRYNLFGWVLPEPREHVNNGPATATDQLGFVSAGATGGKTDDPNRPGERGDHIYVWKNNTWLKDYWLIGQLGASSDDRWWDSGTRDFADFDLEIGQGYYYRHPTNYGAANFSWKPTLP